MVPIPVAAVLEAAPPAAAVAELPACAAESLTLSFDGEDGAFDGMGHSGTLMVVRNIGAAPCRVPGLPAIAFLGPDGRPLPVRFGPPPGLHPGPVVLPVGVAPGAEVTAELRWIQADAFPGGRCYRATAARVRFGAVAVDAPFAGQFCGPAAGATFGQTRLKADSRLRR